MAKKSQIIIDIYGGIAVSKKIGQQGSFRFARHLDITSDPNDLTLQFAGSKDSGTVVDGLVKWIVDATPYNTKRYAYDDNGAIYEIDDGTWTKLQTTANSNGQGLAIHNDYLYYTQDTQIGRYGPLSNAPAFDDDWQTGLNDTSTSGFAPIIVLNDRMIVGHGENVGVWDGAVWTAATLTLPGELNARVLTLADQYVVTGAWRGNAVTDSEDGYVYTYDGLSDTFNEAFPTNGGLNAAHYYRNKLISIHGHQGYIYTDASPFNKIHQIPGVGKQQYLEVFPGAMTTWKELLLFGISNSDSSAVTRGVYTYGQKSALFPEALNYAISISTGNSGSTVQIGAVKGIGNDLYIGWKDGANYGVDLLNENSSYALSGTYESLIVDDGRPGEEKRLDALIVNHLPLAEGESMAIDYKKERDSSWTSGSTNSTTGSTETKLYVDSKSQQFYEFEWRTTLGGDGSSTPTVVSQKIIYDNLKEEEKD
jgi:hypothetical protein